MGRLLTRRLACQPTRRDRCSGLSAPNPKLRTWPTSRTRPHHGRRYHRHGRRTSSNARCYTGFARSTGYPRRRRRRSYGVRWCTPRLSSSMGYPRGCAARILRGHWCSALGTRWSPRSPNWPANWTPDNQPSCWRTPARWCPATTGWKTRLGSTRNAANSGWRSNWPTELCCAATSTALTSRHRRAAGGRLQDWQGAAGGAGVGGV